MTLFEELCKEMGVKVEVGADGLYTGMTAALAIMTNEVILSDDESIFTLNWESQKELIKQNFYKVFPYMDKKS